MCSEGSGESSEGPGEVPGELKRRMEGQRRERNDHSRSIYDPIETWMTSKGEWRVRVSIEGSMRGLMDTGWSRRAQGSFECTGSGLKGHWRDTEGTRSELEVPCKCLEDHGR